MFGDISDKFISFLFLSLKYFIHSCKFKQVRPTFDVFKKCLQIQKETEYFVAKKRGKLHNHFKYRSTEAKNVFDEKQKCLKKKGENNG